MKIALLSSVFGGHDTPKDVPTQEGFEYKTFFFNEDNSRPFPNLNDRLKSKYYKCQSHRVEELKEYDLHCWVDGSVQITSPLFLKDMTTRLLESGGDIVIGKHNQRECIYDELDVIINSKDEYLTSRYANQQLPLERAFYVEQGHPPKWGLWSCGIWMRHNGIKMNEAFDLWWDITTTYSYFDQAAFPYSMRKHGINIVQAPYIEKGDVFKNDYFYRLEHNKIA
jgi:hypothetical protein